MTGDEYAGFMDLIVSEFETLGAKLQKRGLLAQEWRRALINVPHQMAESTLRRWVWKMNTEPTLDRFMGILDEIQQENMRVSYRHSTPETPEETMKKVLTDAQLRQKSDDDFLWASLHLALAHKLIAASKEEKIKITQETYTAIQSEYPQFKLDCINALAGLGISDGPIPF